MGLDLKHTAIGGEELSLVESLFEALAPLCNLLGDLVVEFGDMVFDEHVGAVALLRVAVVDQRIVESVDMAAGFPDCGVHEDSRVDADDILVEQRHRFPPIAFDIILEFDAVLAVVVDGGEAVVDFRRGEHEAVFLGVRHYFLKDFVLSCHNRD